MVSCYIIDDEKYSINSLIKEIELMPGLELLGFNTNPLVALEEIKQGKKPDIVFLDVEMPQISGLNIVKLLPETIAVIIRTSFSKYAKNAFDVNAIDFLFKPYEFDRFVKSIMKAQEYLQKFNAKSQAVDFNSIFISSNSKGEISQIVFAEIIFIEAIDHTISIHTKTEAYITRMGLGNIEMRLPLPFIRVHRGFIVNINLIKSFNSTTITLINNTVIPLGERHKVTFLSSIKLKTLN